MGAIPYCSINARVAGCLYSRARSHGVFPSKSLAFGSAPASMRALMISSGASQPAARCNAFLLYYDSVVALVW
jgi:hypothetical protein